MRRAKCTNRRWKVYVFIIAVTIYKIYKILNYLINFRWIFDQEDRSGEMPFALEVQFTLAIAINSRDFRVAINGVEFCKYPRHSQLSEIYGLKMYGSFGGHIEVTSVDHVVGLPPEGEEFVQLSELY